MASYTKVTVNSTYTNSGYTAGKTLGFGSWRQYNSAYWWTWHTAPSGTTSLDEIWIWIYKCNSSYNLQAGFGTSSSTGQNNSEQIYFPTSSTNWLYASGVLMQNSDHVMGISSAINYNWQHGYVNRLTY